MEGNGSLNNVEPITEQEVSTVNRRAVLKGTLVGAVGTGVLGGKAAAATPAETVGAAQDCTSTPPNDRGGIDVGPIQLDEATTDRGLWDPLQGMFVHTTAVGDVDGDGWPDLYVGSFYQQQSEEAFFSRARRVDCQGRCDAGISPDRLLLGGPDGFTVADDFPGEFLMDGNSSGSAFADFSGNGYQDLVVSQYYNYELPEGGSANVKLLANEGGSFTPVGTILEEIAARGIAVLDYDGDGRLDLFVVEDRYYEDAVGLASGRLLRNSGGMEFEDVTEEVGLPTNLSGLAAAAADFTGNGYPDLLVSGSLRPKGESGVTETQRARLFTNTGGQFREADASAFTFQNYSWRDESAGVAVADLTRNGKLDVVIGAHPYPGLNSSAWPQPVEVYLNRGTDGNGDPVFEDVTDATGLAPLRSKSAHVELKDYDNDGWPDLLVGVGVGDQTQPAVFRHEGLSNGVPQFSNPDELGDERTEPPTLSNWELAGIPRYWPMGVSADFDRDGRNESFVCEWFPELPSRFFTNETEAGHWLEVEVTPQRDAIGAQVEVFCPGRLGDEERRIGSRPIVANTSYGAGAHSVAHFGLGQSPAVDVRITLPHGTGVVERRGVRADQHLTVNLD